MQSQSNFFNRYFFIIAIFCSQCVFAFAQKSSTDFQHEIVLKFKKEHRPKQLKCGNTQTLCLSQIEALSSKSIEFAAQQIAPLFIENTFAIQYDTDVNIEEIIETYQNSGLFEYVENNFISDPLANNFPTDNTFTKQWGLHNEGNMEYVYSLQDADIDMSEAWGIEQGNAGIIVAILDTGVDYMHPDLTNRMWTNTAEIPDNGIDDDGNGYIDDYRGFDFADNDSDPYDFSGHGTHVAGIVGAEANNGIGFTGVDWNCRLMALKAVKDNMSSTYSDYAEAIYYAVAHGARVINISLTSYNPSTVLDEAFAYAHSHGTVLVVSMGNNGNTTTHYMAKSEYSIAVGASTPADRRAGFSCYNDYIDVLAPGSYIFGLNKDNYADISFSMSGTSQAAPHVSGLVSLLLAQNPMRTPEDIRSIIRSTAQDMVGPAGEDTHGFDQYFGYGRINAHDALVYGGGQIVINEEAESDGNSNESLPTDENGCVIASDEEFTTGLGDWISGGRDVNVSDRHNFSIQLRDNSGIESSIYTPTFNLVGRSSVSVDFSFNSLSMEDGEDFIFEISLDGGSSFIPVKNWVAGTDFKNKNYQQESFVVNSFDLSDKTVFRFRCDASTNSDLIYIDKVKITVCDSGVGTCIVGSPCDDGNVCTIDDQYTENCNCVGRYEDKDNDGICAGEDSDDLNECVPNNSGCEDISPEIDLANCESFYFESFEESIGLWNVGGNDASLQTKFSIDGKSSIKLRDNSGEKSSIQTDVIDFSKANQVSVTFEYYANSMELGEDFLFEVSFDGGKSFSGVEKWVSGIDFKNSERNFGQVTIAKSHLTDKVVLRFRCDASSNADVVYLDNIQIMTCGTRSPIDGTASIELTQVANFEERLQTIQLFPNPTVDYIQIKQDISPVDDFDVFIYTLDGTQVLHTQLSVDDEVKIDVTALPRGTQYVVRVVTSATLTPVTATFFKV